MRINVTWVLKHSPPLTNAQGHKKLTADNLLLARGLLVTGTVGGYWMRLMISFFALSLLGAVAQSGCNSAEQKNKNVGPIVASSPGTTAPAPVASDGARRVTVAEAKEMLDKNEAVIIDVRNQASYDTAHIRGAKLIPEAEILNHIDELPKNKLIITYCS